MGSDGVDGLKGAEVSRRVFLQGMGIAMTCPLWSACEFVKVFDNEIVAQTEFSLADEDFGALHEVGGTACLDAGSLALLLIRKDPHTIIACERFCPHQQLSMGQCGNNPLPATWDADLEQLTCRWHQSVFDAEGRVVSGPSPRALRVFPVDFDPTSGNGVVYITADPDANEEEAR